jgi:diketogulonate reductase-like aldo/keto reductase
MTIEARRSCIRCWPVFTILYMLLSCFRPTYAAFCRRSQFQRSSCDIYNFSSRSRTNHHLLNLYSSSSSRTSLQQQSNHFSSNNCVSDDTTTKTMSSIGKNSLSNCPTIPLRKNNLYHPVIGFGTYKVGYIPPSASQPTPPSTTTSTPPTTPRTAVECITDALTVGYRFLECAQFYNNEKSIGQAIQASGIDRKELFLCSKVWTTTIEQGAEAIRTQLQTTLSDLQTDYIDLYLIHWPVPHHHVEAYKTLITLQQEGFIRGIGVSNYAWEDYLELKHDPDISSSDLPLVNQIEINPFLYRANTIAKFQQEGVVLQSYRSLRDGKAMSDPRLLQLATKYSRTPAQILGRWCVQHGCVYIPKSVHVDRMIENANVLDFTMSGDDMTLLDSLTTPEALEAFVALYRKCVNRDTSKEGTMDGVKMEITMD